MLRGGPERCGLARGLVVRESGNNSVGEYDFTFRQPRFVRNTFAFTGMVFWRIRDGKVVESWATIDRVGLQQQPAPK